MTGCVTKTIDIYGTAKISLLNLSGRTLKLQQDQRTGTLHDVEVEQQGLIPGYSDRLR